MGKRGMESGKGLSLMHSLAPFLGNALSQLFLLYYFITLHTYQPPQTALFCASPAIA